MPTSATIAAIGWVASPVIKEIMTRGFSCLGKDPRTELRDLEIQVIPCLQLVIEAAERIPNISGLEGWLRRLKKALYDAEDLIDQEEYLLIKSEVHGKKVEANQSPSAAEPVLKIFRKLSNFSPQQMLLLNKLNQLKKVAFEAKEFIGLLGIQHGDRVGSSSLINFEGPSSSRRLFKVFGRKNERDYMIKQLLEPNSDVSEISCARKYSVVAICGVGGAGKTTLAQYVYDDEKVRNHFDRRIWIGMSRNLDVDRHTKEMIESASQGVCPPINDLDTLQTKLNELLFKSEKTLLVLDDVWLNQSNMNEAKWTQFLTPLSKIPNIKILVTSRSKRLPHALGTRNIIDIKNLEEDDFLSLLKYYAFESVGDSDFYLRDRFEKSAKGIANNLNWSPLGAVAVGSRLNKRMEIDFWERTEEKKNLDDIREALLWSFQQLDAHLQRCFLYCSIFPKGSLFNINDLVLFWMAEGFINTEDEGKDNFHELMSGSFFKTTISKRYSSELLCSMHDLFHDLAESLSAEDCFRIENDEITDIIPTVCHLLVDKCNLKLHKSSICKLVNLRTLILIDPTHEDLNKTVKEILTKLRKLRVLHISSFGYNDLPKIIGKLKHLRYLNIVSTLVSRLPNNVCKLYHLQLLRITRIISSLPKKITHLIKLRHLDAYDIFQHIEAIPVIPNIGRLTLLHNLEVFRVREEKGYKLEQLENMQELRGCLKIMDLPNVGSKADSLKAKLKNKKHLEELHLIWPLDETIVNRSSDLELIEGLQPHPKMKKLFIHGYMAENYPNWLTDDSCIPNLEILCLSCCPYLEVLPPILSKSHIKSLILNQLPKIKELPKFPISLTELQINDCPSLASERPEGPDNTSDLFRIVAMMVLTGSGSDGTFLRRRVSMHLELPYSLCSLILTSCYVADEALADCLRNLIYLTELQLKEIHTLTRLPSGEVLQHLKKLRFLKVELCLFLESLGGLRALISLKVLHIISCRVLTVADIQGGSSILPSSLHELLVDGIFFSNFFLSGELPQLRKLEVKRCKSSESLPIGHLIALSELALLDCPDLCKLEGLPSLPNLRNVTLVLVPKLNGESFLECRGGWGLVILSSDNLLKQLFSTPGFVAPTTLIIEYSPQETFSFEGVHHLSSIKFLIFYQCNIQSFPESFRGLSSLHHISFQNCPNILSLPKLPESIEIFVIGGCPILKERCREHKGEDWPKIANIRQKNII